MPLHLVAEPVLPAVAGDAVRVRRFQVGEPLASGRGPCGRLVGDCRSTIYLPTFREQASAPGRCSWTPLPGCPRPKNPFPIASTRRRILHPKRMNLFISPHRTTVVKGH